MSQSRKKQRECPAIHGTLTPAECGEGRSSRYNCPADCPYNPWNPSLYDECMRIGLTVLQKLNSRAEHESGTKSPPLSSFPSEVEAATQSHARWFIEVDKNSTTLYGRWEAAGFPGLNNDQQVYLRALAQFRVVLLEAVGFVDSNGVLAQDRLNPASKPFIARDRSLVAGLGRFDRLLTAVFTLPHYFRFTGVGISLPDVGDLEAEEIIGGIATHLGGPAGGEPLRVWLAPRFVLIEEALGSIYEALRRKSFESLTYTYATYRLTCPPLEFIKAMSAQADTVQEPPTEKDKDIGAMHSWTWLVPEGQSEGITPPAGAKPTLGRMLLFPDSVTLEGATERSERLQTAFEASMGDKVSLKSTRVNGIGRQMFNKQSNPCNMSLVPPDFLQYAQKLSTQVYMIPANKAQETASEIKNFDSHWADDRMNSLGGLSPREAVREAKWRPTVIRMLKTIIRQADRHGLAGDPFHNEAIMAEELGLDEIAIPPPPTVKATPPCSFVRPNSPPSRTLSVLDQAEVIQRIDLVIDQPETLDTIIDDLECYAMPILDWVESYPETPWEDNETDRLDHCLCLIWASLFPDGGHELNINMIRFNDQFRMLTEKLKQSKPNNFIQMLAASRQPALCQTLLHVWIEQLNDEMETFPHPIQLFGLIMIRLVIDELDLSARGL